MELLKSLEAESLRRDCRSSLRAWARLNGFVPASHHELLIDCLEKASRTPDSKFIFNLPPGTAKSTYSSFLFIPWYLAQEKNRCILGCSHDFSLICSFSRRARNSIELHKNVIGYSLRRDSRAVDEWDTTNGGHYYCRGVGAGIAGHRADLGLIDDYCGSEQDADSETFREANYRWYIGDFVPRLRPGAAQVIIATRRHEKDLVGMILAEEGDLWTIIKIPWNAKDNDPLGREKGARIWPEYTTPEMERRARKDPRVYSCQYQQEPTAEDGDYFKAEDVDRSTYIPSELPADLRAHVGSDHAINKREENDKTCMVQVGVDESGVLWVLPSIVWDRLASDEQVDKMFEVAQALDKKYGAVWWVAEKEKITDCLGPYITKRMRDDGHFFVLEQVVPKKDKRWRARSLQALVNTGMVRFPSFAPWWPDARRELLAFDNLGEDDFVDALAHIARKINSITSADAPPPPDPEPPAHDAGLQITMKDITANLRLSERDRRLALQDS